MWLIYLGILVFQPALDPTSTWRQWALILVLVVVFLPIYGWTMRHIGSRPYLWRAGTGGPGAVLGVCALIALGVAAAPFNSGSSVFFIYAAAAAGLVRPRGVAFALLAAAFLGVLVAALISSVPRELLLIAFLPAAIFVPITGLSAFYERERAHSNARLRMAQDEIERLATIAERERIARDLHDLLGHTLSTITLKSELAARMVQIDPARAEGEMRDVERISRDALGQVRSAVRGYRTGGLEGELANVRLALEAAQVEYDYYYERLDLPPAIEGVVALAVREAVTNVIRHAQARTCTVTVRLEGGAVVSTIEDDGVGPPVDRSGAGAATGGLTIMRSRVEALGGDFEFGRTGPGEKARTRLRLRLPLGRSVAATEDTRAAGATPAISEAATTRAAPGTASTEAG